MVIWRSLPIFVTVPDDPSFATAPHQDNFALNRDGDYRRLWMPLTDIPFGDGGLALALGSHRRELPPQQLRDFAERPGAAGSIECRAAMGVDPSQVGDQWHTAVMEPGDLIVFNGRSVHRSLPATSDRIRIALGVVASGASDPRPPTMLTAREAHARVKQIRALAGPLQLSRRELFKINVDLSFAGVTISEETVRAAARGEYSRA